MLLHRSYNLIGVRDGFPTPRVGEEVDTRWHTTRHRDKPAFQHYANTANHRCEHTAPNDPETPPTRRVPEDNSDGTPAAPRDGRYRPDANGLGVKSGGDALAVTSTGRFLSADGLDPRSGERSRRDVETRPGVLTPLRARRIRYRSRASGPARCVGALLGPWVHPRRRSLDRDARVSAVRTMEAPLWMCACVAGHRP
jgi:hypothetical protein